MFSKFAIIAYIIGSIIGSVIINIPALIYGVTYHIDLGYDTFLVDPPYVDIYNNIELVVELLMYGLVFVMYISAFVALKLKGLSNQGTQKKERRCLYQGAIVSFPYRLSVEKFSFRLAISIISQVYFLKNFKTS